MNFKEIYKVIKAADKALRGKRINVTKLDLQFDIQEYDYKEENWKSSPGFIHLDVSNKGQL